MHLRIDDLVAGDGDNRTEFWKMILTSAPLTPPVRRPPLTPRVHAEREYVYNKVINMKSPDGAELQKTFKVKTPHWETHCV